MGNCTWETAEKEGVLIVLIETSKKFWEEGIPCSCMTDEQEPYTDPETGQYYIPEPEESGHWSGTLKEIKESLGRELTEPEVTVLSISRNFGPMPLLKDTEIQQISQFLFPKGNGSGQWYQWYQLAEKLQELLD